MTTAGERPDPADGGPAPAGAVLSGAVLAGGASRRMGSDKALLDVGGRPLVEVALDALRELGVVRLTVVGPRPGWPQDLTARLVARGVVTRADGWPGEGPLGGILTALLDAADPPDGVGEGRRPVDAVVVLPCDLAAVAPGSLRRLVEAVAEGAQGAVLAVDGRPMPVVGVLRPTVAEPLRAVFTGGARRADAVLAVPGVVTVDVDPAEAPIDLDDPEALDHWRRRPTAG